MDERDARGRRRRPRRSRSRRPRPLWSEQDPEDWWRAADDAVRGAARARARGARRGARRSGSRGRCTAPRCSTSATRPLRPAILWNDGRSAAQCARARGAPCPTSRAITGNLAMPGFTAPKLLWVREHEPELFARIAPRAAARRTTLRLRLTGERATDCSDASGTLWLDVAARRWSSAMLAACGLDERAMPRLFEGTRGRPVRCAPSVAARVGLRARAGRGRRRRPGGRRGRRRRGRGRARPRSRSAPRACYFVADDRFRPNPERAVHAFCHCAAGHAGTRCR